MTRKCNRNTHLRELDALEGEISGSKCPAREELTGCQQVEKIARASRGRTALTTSTRVHLTPRPSAADLSSASALVPRPCRPMVTAAERWSRRPVPARPCPLPPPPFHPRPCVESATALALHAYYTASDRRPARLSRDCCRERTCLPRLEEGREMSTVETAVPRGGNNGMVSQAWGQGNGTRCDVDVVRLSADVCMLTHGWWTGA